MSSKRQQTMAKLARERLVKERRALKLEKRQAARDAKAAGESSPVTGEDDAAPDAGAADSSDEGIGDIGAESAR